MSAVFEFGVVGGLPVELHVQVPVGSGYILTLGLTSDRRVVGEWSPRMPQTFSAANLARKIQGAVARLCASAAARPGLLIVGWRIPLPPASESRSGAPLIRSRRSAALVAER